MARAANPEYDGSRWQTISLMHTWSSLDGEAWFRASVALPDEVASIPLTGSRLELKRWHV